MTKFKVGDRVMNYCPSYVNYKAKIINIRDNSELNIAFDKLVCSMWVHPKCVRKLKKKVKLSKYYVTTMNGSVVSVYDKPEPADGYYNKPPYKTMPIEEFLKSYYKEQT